MYSIQEPIFLGVRRSGAVPGVRAGAGDGAVVFTSRFPRVRNLQVRGKGVGMRLPEIQNNHARQTHERSTNHSARYSDILVSTVDFCLRRTPLGDFSSAARLSRLCSSLTLTYFSSALQTRTTAGVGCASPGARPARCAAWTTTAASSTSGRTGRDTRRAAAPWSCASTHDSGATWWPRKTSPRALSS